MKFLLTLLILPVLLLACGGNAERGDSGEVVSGGNVKATSLRMGDCFQDWQGASSDSVSEVFSLKALPCTEPHDNEVFYTFKITGQVDWPGRNDLEEIATLTCLDEFEPFVGRSYASSILDYGALWPTKDTWDQLDDREITCFLFDFNLLPLVGSMRSSGK